MGVAAETGVFISCVLSLHPPPHTQSGVLHNQRPHWVGLIMGKGSLQSLNYFPSIWKEQYQPQKHGLPCLPSKSSFVLPWISFKYISSFFYPPLPAFGSLNFCCWRPCARELSSFQIRRPFWMVQLGYLGYLFILFLPFCKIIANWVQGAFGILNSWFSCGLIKNSLLTCPYFFHPLLFLFPPLPPLPLDCPPIPSLSGRVLLCSLENSNDNFKGVGLKGKWGTSNLFENQFSMSAWHHQPCLNRPREASFFLSTAQEIRLHPTPGFLTASDLPQLWWDQIREASSTPTSKLTLRETV